MHFAPGTGGELQPYKYNNKELDQMHGLNMYDYSARRLALDVPRFTTVDPLAEKYYSISPYVYAGNNPIRNIDIKGDSITVLNMNDGEHMAILIQNDKGKWQYYSVNGDNVYIPGTDIHLGGRKFDDLAVGEFDSPEQFMQSAYNSKGDKDDKSINKYGFTEGYILATTPEQDATIRETFVGISQNEEYGIFSNNCATAVQRSLNAVGIKTSETKRMTDVMIGPSTKEVTPWLPSQAFKAIRNSNPNGTYIRKK
jgi:RHS repeat-associated protein